MAVALAYIIARYHIIGGCNMDGITPIMPIAIHSDIDEIHGMLLHETAPTEQLVLVHDGVMYYVRDVGGRLMLVESNVTARRCYGGQDEHGQPDCDGPDVKHVHCVSHDGETTFDTDYCADCRMLAVEAGFNVTE
jgi:hypothetical protein